MYPLLAAAGTSVATNLLDSLGSMLTRKNAAPTVDFGAALQQAAGARKAPTPAEQIAALKAQLLNSPELQTALNTADPTHGATLSLSESGQVTYTAADGRTSALTLSPATANMARQLAGMMGESGQYAASNTMPLTGANSIRSLNAFA